MKSITLEATSRGTGKSAAHATRREGNVPAVLYGKGIEPVSLQVNAADCKPLIYTNEKRTVSLELDGKTYPCIAKQIDFHPVSDRPEHIDFQLLVESEPIRTKIPVHITGKAAGVTAGGELKRIIHEVEVECLPGNLPSFFAADVTKLKIGGVLRVSDVAMEGVKMLSPASQAIAMVVTKRAAILPEDEEEEEGEEGEEGAESEGEEDSDES